MDNEDSHRKTKDISPRKGEMIKPSEIIGIAGTGSWSLTQRRCWDLLLVNAWGPELDRLGAVFSIELRELRGLHDSNDRLKPSLRLFQQTLVEARMPDGKTRTVQLLGATDMDDEDREDGILIYDFHPKLIPLLRESEIYARMEVKVLSAFTSKYALGLYEVISARINLRKSEELIDVATLRLWLGVDVGKLDRWPDLNRFALQAALREVNGLSPYEVAAEPIKRGRKVVQVRVSWSKKAPFSPSEQAAAREVNRAKVGRKSRLSGTVDLIEISPVTLSERDIQKGYETAFEATGVRIDKQAAYVDWQGYVSALPTAPHNPTGHFIEFCRKRAHELK